jgi:hypothetical protein
VFLDTARMRSGQGDAMLGWFSNGEGAGSVYLNCTRGRPHTVRERRVAQAITVIDLSRARSGGFKPDAIVGRIPVGRAPVGAHLLARRALPSTPRASSRRRTGAGALSASPRAGSRAVPPDRPAGAVIVVDVERARRDPSNSVAARVPAGCHPVRLALSAKGDAAYVTARKSNALLAFDTAKLVSDSTRAGIGSVPVGPAPVGVTVARAGGRDSRDRRELRTGSRPPAALRIH